MLLKDCKLFKLPLLLAGFFSGMDRLYIPHNMLILTKVTQRADNGNVELFCQASEGFEKRRGFIQFLTGNRKIKDDLYIWFTQQINKDIEKIYQSEFKSSDN